MTNQLVTPEAFLTDFESIDECFPLLGGIVGGRGETESVEIANYHAPMHDLLDIETYVNHLRNAIDQPRIALPLEILPDFKYGFDPADTWFRVGRKVLLHTEERRISVGLVCVSYESPRGVEDHHWIYRDKRGERVEH